MIPSVGAYEEPTEIMARILLEEDNELVSMVRVHFR